MFKKNVIKLGLSAVLLVGCVGSAYAGAYQPYYYQPEAAFHHWYFGLQAGYFWQSVKSKTNVQTDNELGVQTTTTTKGSLSRSTGGAGRLSLGYLFNPNFGMEFGFSGYSSTEFTIKSTAVSTFMGQTFTASAKACGNIHVYIADLLLTATLPISSSAYLFTNAGAAYVYMKQTVSFDGSSGSQSVERVAPEVGVGVGFHASQNADITLSYQQIFGRGNISNSFTPYIGTAYIGARYNFA